LIPERHDYCFTIKELPMKCKPIWSLLAFLVAAPCIAETNPTAEAKPLALKIDGGNDNTADKRMHKHFAIPQDKPIDEQVVKTAILKDLPLGSSPDLVYSYLEKRGVGSDGFSIIYPLNNEGKILCGIAYDPESDNFHSYYWLTFQMDKRKRLKNIVLKIDLGLWNSPF